MFVYVSVIASKGTEIFHTYTRGRLLNLQYNVVL